MSHQYTNEFAKTALKEIDSALAMSKDETQNANYRLGYMEGTLIILKCMLEIDNEEIGRTTVVWIKGDVRNEFIERYEREPTEDELNEILGYLDLNECGEEACCQAGWDRIYTAFDDYESAHEDEE